MDSLALRVATRYQRQVLAAYLSQKWFKGQKDALKNILKQPVKDEPRYWGWLIQDRLIPFFKAFREDFDDVVQLPQARDSIKNRVEMASSYVESVASKLPKDVNVDFKDPASYLKWYATNSIHEKIKEQVTTLGDLLKSTWAIDYDGIDRLVQKTLKAAKPEEKAALTDDTFYRTKYEFLARVGFEKAALRLVKKSKLDWDPTKWVDRIFDMLQANYSEQAIQDSASFREFDLNGMKVIVDDATVDDGDIKKYVRYLDEAYARMKSKGFAKAWYGNVFIRCKDCGGVNPNTGGGTGGWYETAKDTVTIFNRPAPFIVELMVHELGHRFWFKQMRPEQRARFESLVKTHTKPRPSDAPKVHMFKDRDLQTFKRDLAEAERNIGAFLARIPNVKNLTILKDAIGKAGWDFGGEVLNVIQTMELTDEAKPAVKDLKDDVYETSKRVMEFFNDFDPAGDISAWLSEAKDVTEQLLSEARLFLDVGVQRHNLEMKERLKAHPGAKDWYESLVNNPAPVPAVSDYGKSDIDEAFAEVFAHYVLEYDITRDQIESFRSVISSDDALVTRVVQAWKAATPLIGGLRA